MTTGRLDATHCEILLKTEHIGRLACHAAGKTYVVPVTYVFDRGAIYGHTNPGLKVEMLRSNPAVCFEVDHLDNMANWRSVVAWGTFEELTGSAKTEALDILFQHLTPVIRSQTSLPTKGAISDDLTKEEIKEKGTARAMDNMKIRPQKGIVYRIKLTEMTGRYEKEYH